MVGYHGSFGLSFSHACSSEITDGSPTSGPFAACWFDTVVDVVDVGLVDAVACFPLPPQAASEITRISPTLPQSTLNALTRPTGIARAYLEGRPGAIPSISGGLPQPAAPPREPTGGCRGVQLMPGRVEVQLLVPAYGPIEGDHVSARVERVLRAVLDEERSACRHRRPPDRVDHAQPGHVGVQGGRAELRT